MGLSLARTVTGLASVASKAAVAVPAAALFVLTNACAAPPTTTTATTATTATAATASGTTPSIQDICGECKVERYARCGADKFVEGPTFDAAGNLWAVSLFSGEVLKIPAGADRCEVVAHTGGAPNGARLTPDGKLLIADRDRNLLSFDPSSKAFTVVATKYGRETLRGLNDLVPDKAGGWYFTEPYGSNALRPTGRVFYLPPGAGQLKLVAENFAFPNGIALSPDEKRLYVSDFATNRIIAVPLGDPGQVNPLGTPYVFAHLEGGMGPDGLNVDARGNVYAAHYFAGRVRVFTAFGEPYGSIRLPEGAGRQTTNVTFRDGHLYITEAGKGEVWRVKTAFPGTAP